MDSSWRTSWISLIGYLHIFFNADLVGGGRNSRSDNDGMLIYVGEGINEIYNMPYFDNTMKTNFSVQAGHRVEMACIVRQIGSKTVSWIRKGDGAILSVDDMLVQNDERMEIEKTSYLSQWTLKIRSAEPSDAGQYECQISTEQKLSKIVRLSVTVPSLSIEGSPSILASAGSNITLRCIVRGDAHKTPISWHFQQQDGSIIKLKEKENSIIKTGPGSLLLLRVGGRSAGNYSCSSHKSNTATVSINVVDGERTPEAMLEEEMKLHTSGQPKLFSTEKYFMICVAAVALIFKFRISGKPEFLW